MAFRDLLAGLRAAGGKGLTIKADTLMIDDDPAAFLAEVAPATAHAMQKNWREGKTPDGTGRMEQPSEGAKKLRLRDGGNASAPHGISTGRLLSSLRATRAGAGWVIAATEASPGQLARALGDAEFAPDLNAPEVNAAIRRGLDKLVK